VPLSFEHCLGLLRRRLDRRWAILMPVSRRFRPAAASDWGLDADGLWLRGMGKQGKHLYSAASAWEALWRVSMRWTDVKAIGTSSLEMLRLSWN
jgi:hypothetical protein